MFSEFPLAAAETDLELTVLMPCLNEAETVAQCVTKARRCLDRLGAEGEIVVADNGSNDGSQELAQRAGARVVPVSVRGYGAALFAGTYASRGRYIVMGDADDSYDFGRLDAFLERLRAGADLVMGNRFLGGIRPGAMPWKNRFLGNPVLSGIGRLLFNCPVRDLHCGLRGFSKDAFLRMQLQTPGMEFASEMVIKATLLRLRIEEVPTTLDKDGRSRPPHLRPWRDGWRHLRFMLLFSPRWLFIYPGVLLTLLALSLGLALLPGPIMISDTVGLDVQTLLFASAGVHLGVQMVSFGLCARIYALRAGLLPASPRMDRLSRTFSLEFGLLLGALLCVLGFGGAIFNVLHWSDVGFGQLDPRQALRAAIPAASALGLGAQVVATSFLLSILSIRWRR
jgi:glycosyltransferase involved in cell wall biosynthesis